MNSLKTLWTDEAGVIMSAEAVMIGTIGVLALTAGVGTMATAVNGELSEMGMAVRSFDQSFSVPGFRTSFGGTGMSEHCGSVGAAGGYFGTPGSSYVQAPVEESRAQLQIQFQEAEEGQKEVAGRVLKRLDAAQLQHMEQFHDLRVEPMPKGAEL